MTVSHGFRCAGNLYMNCSAEALAFMCCRHCRLPSLIRHPPDNLAVSILPKWPQGRGNTTRRTAEALRVCYGSLAAVQWELGGVAALPPKTLRGRPFWGVFRIATRESGPY